MNGEEFNSRKAWGAAANAAVVGAVRGALTTSGVGLLGSLGANFGAGALGSAFEQKIGKGSVDFRESVTDGLTNAVSSAIYGNGKLKSLGSAFLRGAGAGAATAAINNLSDALMPRQTKRSGSGRNGSGNRYTGGNGRSPYTRMRNPRACGAPSAFQGGVGYRNAYGYQYEPRKTQHVKRNKFSIGSFAKDVLLGAVMGGFSSALFYGAGKGVEKLAGSLKRSVKGGSNALGPDEMVVSNKKFLNQNGEIDWEKHAPNGGYVPGSKVPGQTIPPGSIIDRYGNQYGRYTSPAGVPYNQRALPYIQNPNAYHQYEVLKPIDNVTMGKIAPAFEQIGGGTQYELPNIVKQLLKDGYLKEIIH